MRAEEILDFIRSYIEQNGYSPSYEEIGHAIAVSKSEVFRALRHLKEASKISFVPFRARTIRLL